MLQHGKEKTRDLIGGAYFRILESYETDNGNRDNENDHHFSKLRLKTQNTIRTNFRSNI